MSREYVLDTTFAPELWRTLDKFTQGYVSAAMWLLTDEDGSPLDYLGLHDIAPETIASAVEDCRAFQETYAAQLANAGDDFRNGADFWLTRNGHGAGFWDRGYETSVDEALTEGAHAYGESDWYVGDDGMVYSL